MRLHVYVLHSERALSPVELRLSESTAASWFQTLIRNIFNSLLKQREATCFIYSQRNRE